MFHIVSNVRLNKNVLESCFFWSDFERFWGGPTWAKVFEGSQKARLSRNPKTGEIIYVPKRNKIRFRASKKLKEIINKQV